MDCLIATCSQLPTLDPDDQFLASALKELGVNVVPAVWTDESVDWASAPVCIVRSTWDSNQQPLRFADWVESVATKTSLFNKPEVIRWNSHKFYTRELEREGIPVVPTIWLERHAAPDLHAILEESGWAKCVIKPAHGGSAGRILRVGQRYEDRERAQAYLLNLLGQQGVLLQPFVSTRSSHHERALVYIGGKYSHAVTKLPFLHSNSDLSARASRPPCASRELPVGATAEEIDLGYRALSVAPEGHVFARVDVVRHEGVVRVMEIELVQPALYFYGLPRAARALANIIVERAL